MKVGFIRLGRTLEKAGALVAAGPSRGGTVADAARHGPVAITVPERARASRIAD